jgi:hypothetical protein
MVKYIADILEWNFRPSDEMVGNVPVPTTTTAAAAASDPSVAVDPATKILRIEKMARIDDDGCFDWEFVPDPPIVLAKEMDTFYPQLPFMVGTPFVAVMQICRAWCGRWRTGE